MNKAINKILLIALFFEIHFQPLVRYYSNMNSGVPKTLNKYMPTQAKSAIATGDGKFIIENITLADPKSDEILVKMKAAGLCHTDYDSLSWGKPIVMGHEGAGLIEKVGSAVSEFTKGDQVILNWATPCMVCFQCEEGNQHICEKNSPVVAGGNGHTPGHPHLEGSKWNGKAIERSFNLGTLSEYALVKKSA